MAAKIKRMLKAWNSVDEHQDVSPGAPRAAPLAHTLRMRWAGPG